MKRTINLVQSLFMPRVALDEDNSRLADQLGKILLVLIGATLLIYLNLFTSPNKLAVFAATSLMLAAEIWALVNLRRGQVQRAARLLCTSLWIILVILAVYSNGVTNVAYIALWLVVILAGLLLSGAAGFIVAGLNTLVGLALLLAESNQALPPPLLPFNLPSFWVSLCVLFFASAGLLYLAMAGFKDALARAKANAQALAESNAALQEMRASLENIVAQRTDELQQRSDYLLAAIEVSQGAASMLDVDAILQNSVEIITSQFNLYYVGIFLVDAAEEWAVLRAGSGAAGQAMLARGHRMRIGSGMIGWCIANAQPRMAAAASAQAMLADAVRLATPELPETRSEAAIPMRSRGRVIGAISVQSKRPQPFSEMEISVFQAIADQLGVTLDNARLLQESRQALQESRLAYGRASQQAWHEFIRSSGGGLSFRYSPTYQAGALAERMHHISSSGSIQGEEQLRAMQTGQPQQKITERGATLFLPVPLRDRSIGVIAFTKDISSGTASDAPSDLVHWEVASFTPWTADEISLLQTIVEQLGFALDSARLYQDTQRLAYRQQLTSEATARIRQTLDIQTILTTAVQEIMSNLNLPEVEISLAAGDEQPSDAEKGLTPDHD